MGLSSGSVLHFSSLLLCLEGSGWRSKYLGPHYPHGRPRQNSVIPTLAWPSPGCWGHLESEPAHGRSLSIPLPFKQMLLTFLNNKIFYSLQEAIVFKNRQKKKYRQNTWTLQKQSYIYKWPTRTCYSSRKCQLKKSQWDTTARSVQCLQIENPTIYKHWGQAGAPGTLAHCCWSVKCLITLENDLEVSYQGKCASA